MNIVQDRIAIAVTLIVLLALPASLLAYKRIYLPHKYHGARIIELTALASDGVWTAESVVGTNYWRKHFDPAPELQLKQGEPVVLRLASADVLHSFSIPLLDIGPIDVPAGEVREVAFTPERPGTLIFLCWQVCSPLHEKLRGRMIVLGPDGAPPSQIAPEEPDLGSPTGQGPNMDEHHHGQPSPKPAANEPDLN